MRKYNIAVIGATGAVGRTLLSLLKERAFPYSTVTPLASLRSKNRLVSFGEDETLTVQALEEFNFHQTDMAFSSAGSTISKQYVPQALKAGAWVVDKGSFYRLEAHIPLMVPEVNHHLLALPLESRLITSPNCVAVPLVMALKAFCAVSPLKCVGVTSLQSVSGAGQQGMDELMRLSKNFFMASPSHVQVFTKPIAFNLIPQIGTLEQNGETEEEKKIEAETLKILEKNFEIAVTCVRVPVFIGHSLSVNVEVERDIELSQLKRSLRKIKGLSITANSAPPITPHEVAGEDLVYLSRLRALSSRRFSFWLVSDNLRKGSALNGIQIAERIISNKKLWALK